MNPGRYIHTVDVSRRPPKRTTTGNMVEKNPQTAFTGVRCLIEPLSARERDTVLGRVSGARYRITWGTEALQEGDEMIFDGRTCILGEIMHDTHRPSKPYQTGILSVRS